MDNWIVKHVEGIMLGVEIAGFILVGSIFVVYFVVARNVKRKRLLEQEYEEYEEHDYEVQEQESQERKDRD